MARADRTDIRSADGTRLAVYEWGNPNGPPVVLVHGYAQCHLSFERQYSSKLAERFRLIAFDQRGHGNSEQPVDAAAYQGRVWADDLAAVLKAKRLHGAVAVGWSMGGRVVRQYLMVHGDTQLAGINFVSSMVIEDPRHRSPNGPRRPPDDQTLEEEIEAGIAFLEACYAHKPPEAEFRRALAYNMRVPAAVRRALAGWTTDPGQTIAALSKVRVPVLITQGRMDTVVLPAASENTLATIPHARISWFNDCGHSLFIENAARFNDELAQFVDSCQAGAPA
jgi:pimeloyl-ACP methyl ester carboxylesterase